MTLSYDSVIKKALDKRNLTIMTIALSVLVLASTIIFGYQVLVVAAVSLVTALLVELMFSKGRKIEFDIWNVFWKRYFWGKW
jgi:Na+-transporting NADH:ubiquinone oxidoreductase subunit B/electron transport complex protein RnfD